MFTTDVQAEMVRKHGQAAYDRTTKPAEEDWKIGFVIWYLGRPEVTKKLLRRI